MRKTWFLISFCSLVFAIDSEKPDFNQQMDRLCGRDTLCRDRYGDVVKDANQEIKKQKEDAKKNEESGPMYFSNQERKSDTDSNQSNGKSNDSGNEIQTSLSVDEGAPPPNNTPAPSVTPPSGSEVSDPNGQGAGESAPTIPGDSGAATQSPVSEGADEGY